MMKTEKSTYRYATDAKAATKQWQPESYTFVVKMTDGSKLKCKGKLYETDNVVLESEVTRHVSRISGDILHMKMRLNVSAGVDKARLIAVPIKVRKKK
jgi:hypothetical protein